MLTFHPFADGEQLNKSSHLVVPSLSIGNVSQLAVDYMINSFGDDARLLGYFTHPALLPMYGPSAFDRTNQVSMSMDLWSINFNTHNGALLQFTVVQQRASTLKGRGVKFVDDFWRWAQVVGFESVYFDSKKQWLRKKLNNFQVLSEDDTYSLVDLLNDYYQMDYTDFKRKFEYRLKIKLSNDGYLIGLNERMPIRDLAYFASKEKKFGKEISAGRERGTWVKTIQQNVDITSSQTCVIA
jgi:hypothetical protein